MDIIDFDFSIPRWIEQVDPGVHERIQGALNQHKIAEGTARDALEQWCSRVFFAKKNIPFAGIPFTISNTIILQVGQHRHIESRTVITQTEPDTGQTYGKEKAAENIWRNPRFEKFKEGSTKWVRCGSGRLDACSSCGGGGRFTCSTCKGSGQVTCSTCGGGGILRCQKCSGNGIVKITCPNCRGKGFIPKTDIAVGGARRSGPGGGVVFTREQCLRCNAVGYLVSQCDNCSGDGQLMCGKCRGAKLLICRPCRGLGTVECKTCKSSGRLYSYEVISAKARVLHQSFLIGNVRLQSVLDRWGCKLRDRIG